METVQQEYEEKQEKGRNYLGDVISEEVAKQLRRKSEDGID